ncbi:MAG: tRNA-2-methylthio-N6-dimethylallyladenosine synthase [Alphaproteobacteria bacterium]|jgi:tRNA-2-methylthio-N6-dimethylallyladenosine synthase
MNEYDSGRMAELMETEGYVQTDNKDEADLVVLNTCHIREKATEKVYSELGRIRHQDEASGKKRLIAVAGCVGQAEGKEIFKRAKNVDMVFGPQSYHKLPEYTKAAQKGEKVYEADFYEEEKFDAMPVKPQINKVTAFLSVQEGCDKFCTFCVVPYTRGAEFSRKVVDITDEAKILVGGGVKEITLLGQNVNAYHGLDAQGVVTSLGELCTVLADINGLERIRYTTSHPRDMSDDLYAAHRDIPKLMPYLHLPIQSGSDTILKKMNRKHTAAEYLDIIAKMRAARPDLALSGDFIVGFPGETDQDFQDTITLIKQVNYASSFSFKYSPRPGTPAADHDNQVPENIKAERLAILQELLFTQQKAFNESLIGQKLPVLIEKQGRYEGQLVGRSPYLQAVYFDAEPTMKIGDSVTIDIKGFSLNSLNGDVVTQKQAIFA